MTYYFVTTFQTTEGGAPEKGRYNLPSDVLILIFLMVISAVFSLTIFRNPLAPIS